MGNYTISITEVTTIQKGKGHILVQGSDHEGKTVSCFVYTSDVDNLWYSIERARNKEKLRTLREDRVNRMKRGRIC